MKIKTTIALLGVLCAGAAQAAPTLVNGLTIPASTGTLGTTNLGDLHPGFALIPGVLHAYKVSAADLGGYTAPVPEPESWAMLIAGLALVGLVDCRRKIAP